MTIEHQHTSSPRRAPKLWLIVLVSVVAVVVFNATVTAPVASVLSVDERNRGLGLYAYRTWAVSPSGITLDLLSVDGDKAPVDLLRVVFQAAGALKDRHFTEVTFARRGRPLFTMDGGDFQQLGASFAAGENPIYLARTLPAKIKRTDGTSAFGTVEPGFLGGLTGEFEDVNGFAKDWVGGVSS